MGRSKSPKTPPTAASVGGLFFPLRNALGLDSREVTPRLVDAVVHLAGELRSFQRAEIATERILGRKLSDSTIRRLAQQVGHELADLQAANAWDEKEVVVPEVAIVSCDGGRIRTRVPGQGRGVVPVGENGWRETKNASFERMVPHAQHQGGVDPCPQLPTSFRTLQKVAKIAEISLPDINQPNTSAGDRIIYKGPQRILRTVLGSMSCSDDFGRMMACEAARRRFAEAPCRAFIGDGLNWNWSIWKQHFRSFVPILDFIHAIQYIFQAAMRLKGDEAACWNSYVQMITACWQGRVDEVIEQLTAECVARGLDWRARLPDDHPDKPLCDAVRYLTNNRSRMDYPRYRRAGLPVTSAPMESLIKQMNLRVKGTEMFWDAPSGAEAILHLRAAVLSDDDRLARHLANRPGCAFVRRDRAGLAA